MTTYKPRPRVTKRKATRDMLIEYDPTDYEGIQRVDLMEIFVCQTTKKARDGDTEAAKEILRDFVGAIDQRTERTWNGPIYWQYARYIADAFEKIIDDKQVDASLALGIKSSKAGRRKGTQTHDTEGLAAAFNWLLLNGLKPKEAKLYLLEKTGANARTIEKANNVHLSYRLYLAHFRASDATEKNRDFASQIIKAGAKPYAAEISVIIAAKNSRKK